ncbi:RNA polymerase sigma factor [Arthrobacter bambusae]|uniref:RNA polymerase sigma factor (Sigma-70 family) n=1 Tax=Arthrobacter bambusae TaxID=1338426 RepID=A0AAW8DEG3_9MICC|nr:sigma-70 family RNA polymerase sigma factor [Arthrobacter bambusae]MDP9904665.1 RNA polymerase sigma factor (sigma-70 family) [Arthrobacter bambusae]MDQ0129481.1 RNA polymerase sigma factor (sigma-70 family) [Arthrobacter bambusae]MDQ0180906.1 RNA polymerase sigma factor (sigma-70 family) [Arthrobacter bambusae]
MHTVEFIPSGEGQAGPVGGPSLVSGGGAADVSPVPPAPEGPLGAESELIGGVRAGDPEATAVLYERYREPGLRFVRGLMSGVQEAEDVFHEGFVKAVGAIRNGHGPTDVFGAYLNTSIRSAASTFWMKRGREQPVPDEELDPGPVEDPGLEAALSLFEHEKVAAAMRSLPERWRIVLWHAEVLGVPPRDIAPMLGVGANAVSALLLRARAGLRAAYERQSMTENTNPAGTNS